MVVHHIHHDAQPGRVQSLHHLLEFPDPDFPVIRIGGIAAFRRVVVLRVVAPVELSFTAAFIHRGEVIDRLQVNVGNAQLLQVIHTGGEAGSIGQSCFSEGQVLSREGGGGQTVGEITDMDFPDDGILIGGQAGIKSAVPETVRIRLRQIDDHAAVPVHANSAGVGIHRLLRSDGSRYGIGVIGSVTAGGFGAPDTFFAGDHGNGFISIDTVACLKQVQHHGGRGGRPDLEDGLSAQEDGTEVVSVIGIVFYKFRAVKKTGGHSGNFAVALDFHRIGPGQVQGFRQPDDTVVYVVAQAGKTFHGDVLSVQVDMHGVQAFEACFRTDGITDFRRGNDSGQLEDPDGIQGFSAVRTRVLHPVAGLQVDFRQLAGQHGETVVLKILCGAAPGASARIGTVPADDETDFIHAFRHVHRDAYAVIAGLEEMTAAIFPGEPDPDVTFFIVFVR